MKIEEFVDTSVYPWWVLVCFAVGWTLLLSIIWLKTRNSESRIVFEVLAIMGFFVGFAVACVTTAAYSDSVEKAEVNHYSAQVEAVNESYGLEAQERVSYGSLRHAIAAPGNYVEAGVSYSEADGVLQRTPLVIKADEDWNLTVYKSLEGDKLEKLQPKSN